MLRHDSVMAPYAEVLPAFRIGSTTPPPIPSRWMYDFPTPMIPTAPPAPTFARRVFFWSAIYGILVLLPQYFLEEQLGRDFPPPINHPEHFYGFLGVALSWQIAFLMIARDPIRFRPIMLAGALEKFAFAIATLVLISQGRAPLSLGIFAGIDTVLGGLFLVAYARCGGPWRSS